MLRGYFGGDNEAELSRKRMAHFAAREAAAPQDQRDHLKKLRDQVASRKLKFTVGYTTALERDAKSITGLVVPANLEEQMRQHAALAKDDPAQTPSPAAAEQQNAEPQPSTAEAKSATEEPAAAEKPKAGEPAVAADKQPSFDWRKQGLVTAVRDQATCASCWAFATVGAFESSWLRQNSSSSSVDMSEQQVVDCSGLGSCNGGWLAFDYLMDHGIGSEQAYPYQAQDMPPESTSPREFRASSWGFVSANPLYEIPSVQRIKKALVEHGPLAVCVRTNDLFRGYTGGVYDDDDPGPTDHALMIIGWDDEKQAWLLKNSWGSEWGEECGYGNERGYMWIAYGSNRIGERAAWVDAQSQ